MLANRPYLIGETAYNHQGDFDYLARMVRALPEEVDAVKFHLLLNPSNYMREDHPLYGMLKDWIFDEGEWNYIFSLAKENQKDIVALCDDPDSLEFVIENWPSIKAVEIHASGLSDYHLLRLASKFPGTVILGIGGSSEEEIGRAIELLKGFGKVDVFLMYGFQSYPTKYEDVGFYRMLHLKDKFGLPIGYADHSPWQDDYGLVISALPCGFGVPVIEKHFTLDKGVERIDWQSAVSPEDLVRIKEMMEIFWQTYSPGRLDMNPSEKAYGRWGPNKKVPCYRRDMREGEVVTLEDLVFLRIPEEVDDPKDVRKVVPFRLEKSVFRGNPVERKV